MKKSENQTVKRLYERVAAELADEIRRKVYAIGDRMPSERDLASKHGVSRPTIREAVIALEVDGLVEVRTGSGVYVKADRPEGGKSYPSDMGLFEILEARRLFEAEAAALAANRINDEHIATLKSLLKEMSDENERDVVRSEDADRRFHMTIAEATSNSAVVGAIELLWQARQSSRQTQHFLRKVRARGIAPSIEEHKHIIEALEKRDPVAARKAMSDHITAVMEADLKATEVEAIERTRAEFAKQRQLYLET